MIVLGIPVLEQHELTQECVNSIANTVADPTELLVIIIDNNSAKPYKKKDFNVPFGLDVVHYDVNKGFYLPLLDLYNKHKDGANLIGLMHNDIYFYEKSWDRRIKHCFATDNDLQLLGFCGSPVVDIQGGRGMHTVANFKGQKGAKTGFVSIGGELVPSAVLDSLFMVFRSQFIPKLLIDENITPCHFYDKIWSLRVIENKGHVGTLGIQIDHMGGQTSCSSSYQEDAKRWCREHNLELEQDSGDLTLYHEAERRFLTEYREQKNMIPIRVDNQYKLWKF